MFFRDCNINKKLPYADAMNKTLVFAIYDFDRFSKHDQIGEVKVPLCMVDLAQTIEEWKEVTSVEGEGGQVITTFAFSFPLFLRRLPAKKIWPSSRFSLLSVADRKQNEKCQSMTVLSAQS